MTDNHQLTVMREILTKWGAICELARNWNGYPTSDTTYRAAFGHGGGKRLPIPNIPAFATFVSSEVMKLPDEAGNAVTLWYAHHFNAAGQWLTAEDKAKLLSTNVHSLRYLERKGRMLLLERAPAIVDRWQDYEDQRVANAVASWRVAHA